MRCEGPADHSTRRLGQVFSRDGRAQGAFWDTVLMRRAESLISEKLPDLEPF